MVVYEKIDFNWEILNKYSDKNLVPKGLFQFP